MTTQVFQHRAQSQLIDWMDEYENASDSLRVNYEIDQSDLHHEKHDAPRISMSQGISLCDDLGKLRINL
jgi:hypothetical protein